MENKSGFKEFLVSPSGKVILIIVLYIVIMGLTALFLELTDGAPIIAVIMAIIFGYFGWQALSRITPDIFLIMPIGHWIAYFVIKGFLAFFLGVFVAPYVIAKKITARIQESL